MKWKIGPYDELQERVELELGKLPSDKQDNALEVAAATAGAVFGISMLNLISPETAIHFMAGAAGVLGSGVVGGIVANADKNRKGNDANQ